MRQGYSIFSCGCSSWQCIRICASFSAISYRTAFTSNYTPPLSISSSFPTNHPPYTNAVARRFITCAAFDAKGISEGKILSARAIVAKEQLAVLSSFLASLWDAPVRAVKSWAIDKAEGKDGESNDDKGEGKGRRGSEGGGDEDDDGPGNDALEDIGDNFTPKVVWFVMCTIAVSAVAYWMSKPAGTPSSWREVASRTETLERIDVYNNFVEFYFEGVRRPLHVGLLDDTEHTQRMMKDTVSKLKSRKSANGTENDIRMNYIGTSLGENLLHVIGVVAWVVPFLFFPSFVMMLTRSIGNAMTGFQEGTSKSAKLMKKNMFKVETRNPMRFCDIAGMREAKQEVTEIVDFLRHPERYTQLGAKVPTGALILGPPGTGKTLLAKAVAGEGGVAFISCAGSDFVELYVGMGALRVRQLFELAKKQKRCIIYWDEIDAIGLKRSGAGHGEKQEQENTLNELLTQLDGFGTHRGDIMVLASTNVSQDQLDPALLRPGRFDRIVNVEPPAAAERADIFKVHLSHIKLISDGQRAAETRKNRSESGESVNNKEKTTRALPQSAEKNLSESPKTKGDEIKTEANESESDLPMQVKQVETTTQLTPSCTALTIFGGSPAPEKELLEESREANKRDIEARKLAEAEKRSLEEKLARLSSTERALVDTYARRMSELCPGFVGADISNVCNEAAILAAREGASHVDITHLERSIDRVLAGIEHRSRVLSAFEKNVVAHHESGHAVVGWFLGRADPLMKVSIVPRGGSALGYAQYLPSESRIKTAGEIRDSICVTFGGRVAEKIFFDHLSTGASDDLSKITKMAYRYVSQYSTTSAYLSPGTDATKYVKPFGAAISNKIDEEAKTLVDEMYERTMKLLQSKKAEMEMLAQHLLKHEVLTHADVVRYLGHRPDRAEDAREHVGMLTPGELRA